MTAMLFMLIPVVLFMMVIAYDCYMMDKRYKKLQNDFIELAEKHGKLQNECLKYQKQLLRFYGIEYSEDPLQTGAKYERRDKKIYGCVL